MPTRSFAFLPTAACLAVPIALALSGCAGFSPTASSNDAAVSRAMTGSVHGGQQPISGSHVHLFEAGSGGYGTASTDDITAGAAGVASDSYGNYVLTDANGNFSLTQYACQNTGSAVYLLATEGNPGYGGTVDNTAISLIASVGTCGSLTSSTSVNINEISTVASVTALQNYFGGLARISSNNNVTSKAALFHSAALAGDLYNFANGTATTLNSAGTGVTPQVKINTLANSLAPCINAKTPGDAACTSLFAAATPPGGTAPADVATAMFDIARNPTLQVTTIYNLATPAAPFAPALAAAPTDWALPIVISGGGITSPQNVAIDANGDAWVTNCPSCVNVAGTDSVAELSPAGVFLSGPAGYTANIHKPTGIAIDSASNVWTTDLAVGSNVAQIVKQNSGGTVDFAFNDSTIVAPTGIALDSNSNAWITMQQFNGSVVQVLANGTRTLAPVTQSGFYYPTGIAIDGAGSIFAAGTLSSNILKLTPAGAIASTFTGSGLDQPLGLTIDHSDNLFTIDNDSSQLTILNGGTGTGSSSNVGVSDANSAAIDGAGTGWIADYVSSSNNLGNLIHVNAAGQVIGLNSGLQDASLQSTSAAAIDASGNIWVTSPGSGKVTLYVGVATPVVTPLAVGTATNTLGTRP